MIAMRQRRQQLLTEISERIGMLQELNRDMAGLGYQSIEDRAFGFVTDHMADHLKRLKELSQEKVDAS